MALRPADISSFSFAGRDYVNVRIRETGAYSIRTDLIEGRDIRPRALEVVSLRLAPERGAYIIESTGKCITSELLADDVRLEILPKFGFDGLAALLAWASSSVSALDEAVPVAVDEGGSVVEIFARRLLADMRAIAANGWAPTVVHRRRVMSDVVGRVDPIATYERLLRGELRFVQDVNETSLDAPSNRAVRTALECLSDLGPRLTPDIRAEVGEWLASARRVQPYLLVREALEHCETILRLRSLDPARGYLYPALRSARPILQALGREFVGAPGLMDVPFRIDMASTVEEAFRNVVGHAVGTRYAVRKESGYNLYREADPPAFNPDLQPDIVLRPISDPRSCVAVMDVKYKSGPAAGDHHQLAAYARAYGARWAAFVTVADSRRGGIAANAILPDGTEVLEYSVAAGDIRSGLSEFAAWIRSRL